MADIEAMKNELATASRILYREGLVEGFGHISVRIQGTDTFLISPPRPCALPGRWSGYPPAAPGPGSCGEV